jgi:hypothetical protein
MKTLCKAVLLSFLIIAIAPPSLAESEADATVPREELPEAPQGQALFERIPRPLPVGEEVFQAPVETPDDESSGNDSVTFDHVNLRVTYNTVRHGFVRGTKVQSDQLLVNPLSPEFGVPEHYHWGGLIAQSLFFNVVENSFRAASDDQIRTLLAHKPFWHDYAASMRQFNMRRWNDGDDFLVNYVGHPMQGAVSGFIEIQNDPTGREQEISATREYWKSRFKAFLWATAYSTHSEISPLGEAGIGNEGGWTYPIHCKTRCTEPGTFKKYTNNTGWVDFIITPTLGTLWLLAEDTLDRYVSDRIQSGDRSGIGPKVVRGALNPSRTMANALRFKAPWYRDSQHTPELENSYGLHLLPSDEATEAAANLRRFQIMPYFVATPLGTAAHPCTLCLENPGAGLEADVLLTSWVSSSFAASKQQGAMDKAGTANASLVNTGFGLRLIHQGLNNTLSLAVRPGFQQTNLAATLDPLHNNYATQPTRISVTHAATSIVLSNDYKISSSLALRSSFGNTIVRYRDPKHTAPGTGTPPYLGWLAHDTYTNRGTWVCSTGPVFRF